MRGRREESERIRSKHRAWLTQPEFLSPRPRDGRRHCPRSLDACRRRADSIPSRIVSRAPHLRPKRWRPLRPSWCPENPASNTLKDTRHRRHSVLVGYRNSIDTPAISRDDCSNGDRSEGYTITLEEVQALHDRARSRCRRGRCWEPHGLGRGIRRQTRGNCKPR